MLTLNIGEIWFIQLNASTVSAVKPQYSMLCIKLDVLAVITVLVSLAEACNNQDWAEVRFLEHGRGKIEER
jgi:hypothetical protein